MRSYIECRIQIRSLCREKQRILYSVRSTQPVEYVLKLKDFVIRLYSDVGSFSYFSVDTHIKGIVECLLIMYFHKSHFDLRRRFQMYIAETSGIKRT